MQSNKATKNQVVIECVKKPLVARENNKMTGIRKTDDKDQHSNKIRRLIFEAGNRKRVP